MSEPLKMWELYPQFWKTESAFLSFIRGGIRRHLWSKNPVKLQFMKESRIQIPNDNARSMKRFPTVSGGRCEMCEGLFKEKDMEVDHRTGEHSLRQISDVQSFVEGVVFVRKEDLAYLCKPCHGIKTYAERYDVSIEEARIEKRVILLVKEGKVLAFLKDNGIMPLSTAAKRRQQCVDYLKGELNV